MNVSMDHVRDGDGRDCDGEGKGGAPDAGTRDVTYLSVHLLLRGTDWFDELNMGDGAPGSIMYRRPMMSLRDTLHRSSKAGHSIVPALHDTFNAFRACSFGDVRVVIVSRGPPFKGAHGLAFSSRGVPFDGLKGEQKNILFELRREYEISDDDERLMNKFVPLDFVEDDDDGATVTEQQQQQDQHDDEWWERCNEPFRLPRTGSLEPWARQGVLLLQRRLTAYRFGGGDGRGASGGGDPHAAWEEFTDAVVRHISRAKKSVVFMLWGRTIQDAVTKLIDARKHLVLVATHPYELSASNGFFGCGHFKLCNKFLRARGERPIWWNALAADQDDGSSDDTDDMG